MSNQTVKKFEPARKFELSFDCGNDAIQTETQIAVVIINIANEILYGKATGQFQNVKDYNGNIIGTWRLK